MRLGVLVFSTVVDQDFAEADTTLSPEPGVISPQQPTLGTRIDFLNNIFVSQLDAFLARPESTRDYRWFAQRIGVPIGSPTAKDWIEQKIRTAIHKERDLNDDGSLQTRREIDRLRGIQAALAYIRAKICRPAYIPSSPSPRSQISSQAFRLPRKRKVHDRPVQSAPRYHTPEPPTYAAPQEVWHHAVGSLPVALQPSKYRIEQALRQGKDLYLVWEQRELVGGGIEDTQVWGSWYSEPAGYDAVILCHGELARRRQS